MGRGWTRGEGGFCDWTHKGLCAPSTITTKTGEVRTGFRPGYNRYNTNRLRYFRAFKTVHAPAFSRPTSKQTKIAFDEHVYARDPTESRLPHRLFRSFYFNFCLFVFCFFFALDEFEIIFHIDYGTSILSLKKKKHRWTLSSPLAVFASYYSSDYSGLKKNAFIRAHNLWLRLCRTRLDPEYVSGNGQKLNMLFTTANSDTWIIFSKTIFFLLLYHVIVTFAIGPFNWFF